MPEVNFAIARFGIRMAEEEISLESWRAELKAHVADGPTRNYYVVVNKSKANVCEPKCLGYLEDLWKPMAPTSWSTSSRSGGRPLVTFAENKSQSQIAKHVFSSVMV